MGVLGLHGQILLAWGTQPQAMTVEVTAFCCQCCYSRPLTDAAKDTRDEKPVVLRRAAPTYRMIWHRTEAGHAGTARTPVYRLIEDDVCVGKEAILMLEQPSTGQSGIPELCSSQRWCSDRIHLIVLPWQVPGSSLSRCFARLQIEMPYVVVFGCQNARNFRFGGFKHPHQSIHSHEPKWYNHIQNWNNHGNPPVCKCQWLLAGTLQT